MVRVYRTLLMMYSFFHLMSVVTLIRTANKPVELGGSPDHPLNDPRFLDCLYSPDSICLYGNEDPVAITPLNIDTYAITAPTQLGRWVLLHCLALACYLYDWILGTNSGGGSFRSPVMIGALIAMIAYVTTPAGV